MYWADKGNIFRSLKNSLYESLFLAPTIILIALFCNMNTHLLSEKSIVYHFNASFDKYNLDLLIYIYIYILFGDDTSFIIANHDENEFKFKTNEVFN